MLLTNELPLKIPLDTALPPELSVLRQDAAHACEGESKLSYLYKVDVLGQLANKLLKYQSELPRPEIEEILCVTIIDMAFYYQQVAEDLIQKAYTDDLKEAWSNSSLYNKRSIGLLQYLGQTGLSTNSTHLGLVQTYSKCWALSQQLSVVMLSLSKLKSSICGKGSKDSRYDRLLEFQESDLKDLAKSSLLYSRLCIGCRNTCSQLSKSSIAASSHLLVKYLEALSFILLSLDRYKNDDCGMAIGLLESATSCLSEGLITSKQLKSIQESQKVKDKLSAKLNDIKKDSASLRDKLKLFNKQENVGKPQLHPFLQSTLQDFIVPLIMLLNYRYVKTNDKVLFQTVIRDHDELMRTWPQGKSPDVIGTIWSFDGEALREVSASSNVEYY
ncbi:LADA_0B04698g1_1 [Lachancea dasiensis]|uniref:LADA_0B04698g1_1 n=1 Tax=Lachancea dasiensis TaxID=1072105 RepID=A0A1G4ISX3_9SACH|nr:LADA_0B04698g1_1 [Lachancea dasiensis]